MLSLVLSGGPAAGAPCDLTAAERDFRVSGPVEGDLFINTGETVLITNATIAGNVLLTTGAGVTHVSVINSRIDGGIFAAPLAGSGDGSICVRGGSAGAVVSGDIAVEAARENSKVEVRNNVEVFGGVSLSRIEGFAPSGCGGDYVVRGNNRFNPVLHGGGNADGACEVDVRKSTFQSDFEADGTAGDVVFRSNTIDGDFQVQNASGDVLIENVTSTSDIEVDGADNVEWINDQVTGGDAEFFNITGSLIVDNVGNVTPASGLSVKGPIAVARITNSTFLSGVELDLIRDLTISGNAFPEGGVKVSSEILGGVYASETAVIAANTLGGGSLEVINVRDVTVTGNTIGNGNLTILGSVTCEQSGNVVTNGNVETAGCNGGGGGGGDGECTGTLDNESFPGGGALANNQWYWCDEDKVFGFEGEVQAGDPFNIGFANRAGAKADAQANLSNGEAYSSAKWKQNQGVWNRERNHVIP